MMFVAEMFVCFDVTCCFLLLGFGSRVAVDVGAQLLEGITVAKKMPVKSGMEQRTGPADANL